jgi:hypothetical protein
VDVTAYAFYSQSDNGDNKTWDGLDDEPTGRVSPEDERDLARRMKYLESEAFKKKGQQSIDQARLFMARKFGVEEELRAALAKIKATVADDKTFRCLSPPEKSRFTRCSTDGRRTLSGQCFWLGKTRKKPLRR